MDNTLSCSTEYKLLEKERKWITAELNKYGVSYTRGFVPDQNPLLQFNNPYFSIWDKIFEDLTSLIQSRSLQLTVEQMPLLDHNKLGNEREWGRAFTVLATIAYGYVWQNGETNPTKMIPKHLAVPLVAAAEHMGSCPVGSLWPCALNNWKIIDENGPLDLSNVEMQSSFTGTKDELWFFKIHLQLEIKSAPGIRGVVAGQKAVLDDDPKLLRACLTTIQSTCQILGATLKQIHEHCDPYVFYTKLRVFLAGWKNNKSLPDGIIYEGVSAKPLKFSGGSGAQSAIFPLFDAFLGIKHPRKDGETESFLESMMKYMPHCHREFVQNVRKGPSVRDYVTSCKTDEMLKIYNDCVESLVQFRSIHIQITTRYVTIQAAKGKKHGDVAKALAYGTAGSAYVSFLKRIRSETSEVKIE